MNRVTRTALAGLTLAAFALPLAFGIATTQASENAPASGSESALLGEILGTDAATIEEALAARGYGMRSYDAEDGHIEVEALREGAEIELYLDRKSGRVIEVERE